MLYESQVSSTNKSDEATALLRQLQLDRNTQSTTLNKAHQGEVKIQKQQKIDDK